MTVQHDFLRKLLITGVGLIAMNPHKWKPDEHIIIGNELFEGGGGGQAIEKGKTLLMMLYSLCRINFESRH